MAFSRPVTEIIKLRSSQRTYTAQPIEAKAAQSLKDALDNPPTPPFGGSVRVALLEAFDAEKRGVKKLGTYGFIKGAKNYLVGVVDDGEHAMQNFGYVFEWAVLNATDLELATCWVGGTLKRGAFAKAVEASSKQIIPAVSPVGYSPKKRRVFDSAVCFMAGSKKRKPFEELFFDGDFSTALSEQSAGQYTTVLEMVRLGPSASNRQPWRIVKQAGVDNFHLFVQRTKGYHKMTSVDLQKIDMGIAMCHFELTAAESGLAGDWQFEPPGNYELPERTEFMASWIAASQAK
ncbi:MAG: nitroreductase [Deltaproteobacteria bacterium]|nr:nitroreductase [Deltaproteobacteria bacterium]MBW1871690.1 nitroreductase [Deltaproteobacteria bacterium]